MRDVATFHRSPLGGAPIRCSTVVRYRSSRTCCCTISAPATAFGKPRALPRRSGRQRCGDFGAASRSCTTAQPQRSRMRFDATREKPSSRGVGSTKHPMTSGQPSWHSSRRSESHRSRKPLDDSGQFQGIRSDPFPRRSTAQPEVSRIRSRTTPGSIDWRPAARFDDRSSNRRRAGCWRQSRRPVPSTRATRPDRVFGGTGRRR